MFRKIISIREIYHAYDKNLKMLLLVIKQCLPKF